MPSTASPLLRTEQQAAGENLNTWGAPKLNQALLRVEDAIAGILSFTLSGSRTLSVANYSADEARLAILNITGGTGGMVTLPSVSSVKTVRNAAMGDAVFTTGAGTTATVAPDSVVSIVCDGTNVFLFRDAVMATEAYVDAAAFEAQQGNLPGQTGNTGKFLKTDGANVLWADPLPAQTGNANKVLTTNGTSTSWLAIPAQLPSMGSQSGKYLTNNGSIASWASLPAQLPAQGGQGGKILSTDGALASWIAPPLELPSQTGNAGEFLTTNGTNPAWTSPFPGLVANKFLKTDGAGLIWADVPTDLPAMSGQSGLFLTNNGTVASWVGLPTELPSQAGNAGRHLTTNGTAPAWTTALTATANTWAPVQTFTLSANFNAGATFAGKTRLNYTPATLDTDEAGFRGAPQNLRTGAYSFVLNDAGRTVQKDESTARAYTIPQNSSVAFPLGTVIVVVNTGSGAITLTRGSGVALRMTGVMADANRALAQWGQASLLKVGTDSWLVSGAGLT